MHYLSSLFWIYPKIYQSDVPRERFLEGIMIRCLKPQLDPFEVKKQYFYSELSPNVWSLYPIYLWGWAQPCCSEKSFWSLVSIISFVWSLLEAEGDGWSIDKVVNGKIFLPAPSSLQLFWYGPIHLLISSSILLCQQQHYSTWYSLTWSSSSLPQPWKLQSDIFRSPWPQTWKRWLSFAGKMLIWNGEQNHYGAYKD